MKSHIFNILIISVITVYNSTAQTQPDTLDTFYESDEVVVTATRNERLLGSLPMPIHIIKSEDIKQTGAVSLNSLLEEQTGLFITGDQFGNGVQVQGLDPDYTLILIDGEPLVGRTAGTLELNRVTTENIAKIEFIKGPSSSLYGSDALAGVINIITENPNQTKIGLSSKYEFNRAYQFSANGAYKKNDLGFTIFGDYYHSDGFDLDPSTKTKTIDPFNNYTLQSKLNYRFTETLEGILSMRFFHESQDQYMETEAGKPDYDISGFQKSKDVNIGISLNQNLTENLKLNYRFYSTIYQSNEELRYTRNDSLFDESTFLQEFHRPEFQAEWIVNNQNILTSGIGNSWESVEANRYTEKKQFENFYVFSQWEYYPSTDFTLILGARFDKHSNYNSQVSPKLSLKYNLTDDISLNGSAGVGFKAPDFRQLYLNFTNPVAGYSVFGTDEAAAGIKNLLDQNQILEVFISPESINNIKPERSLAFNFGTKIRLNQEINFNLNFFRNDIKDLIETLVIARKTNGQSVFSYTNLNRIYTQGFDAEGSFSFWDYFKVSAGYQYLIAKDKDVEDQLKEGSIYKRDPVIYVTTRVKEADYGGLFNRSRHLVNAKIQYFNSESGFSGNLRMNYKGRYGFADKNNNTILDQDNEYVEGYFIWNTSVSKKITDLFEVQIGCDNLTNFTNTEFIPSISGRLWWVRLSFQDLLK